MDCRSGNLNKLGLNEVLNSTRDQPSPTSVLDAPSEDSSCNEPESSASTTSKNASKSSFQPRVLQVSDWLVYILTFLLNFLQKLSQDLQQLRLLLVPYHGTTPLQNQHYLAPEGSLLFSLM